MKWFNKTAQGFSPGYRQNKSRPERAADASACRHHLSSWRGRIESVALSGRALVDALPRAKALGCSVYALRAKETQKEIL